MYNRVLLVLVCFSCGSLAQEYRAALTGLIPGTGLKHSTTKLQDPLLPSPDAGGLGMGANNNSWYHHSSHVRVEKRHTHGVNHGVNVLANYIWSEMIERVSRLNTSGLQLEKRPSNTERAQRVGGSGSYELPFGSGRPIMFYSGKWADRLIGGWIVNAIYSFEMGAPLAWGDVIYLRGGFNNDPRNVTGRAFETMPFVAASSQQRFFAVRTFSSRLSNLGTDSTNNLYASLSKNIRLTGKVNLQLRFEAFNALNEFNALNYVRFSGPNPHATGSRSGCITRQDNLPRQHPIRGRGWFDNGVLA